MYRIIGNSQRVNICQDVDLDTLCRMAENLFCRSVASYQTWYELFVSPDDGEMWNFLNQKRNYSIVVVYTDEL
jgi:hypothetical protein